jgi:hypothetical protein
VSLPHADDLFRPTAGKPAASPTQQEAQPADDAASAGEETGRRRSSGRVRHDEKMTVYITSEELLDLEHARLSLRRTHGLAVDRGRLVREAVALVLADLESRGDESALVRRLREA